MGWPSQSLPPPTTVHRGRVRHVVFRRGGELTCDDVEVAEVLAFAPECEGHGEEEAGLETGGEAAVHEAGHEVTPADFAEGVGRDHVLVRVEAPRQSEGLAVRGVTLVQAVGKGTKTDRVVPDATALGVARLVFVLSERAVARGGVGVKVVPFTLPFRGRFRYHSVRTRELARS